MVIQKLPKFHNERILEMISVIPFLLPMALYFDRRTYHLQHRVNYSAFPRESGRLFFGERGKYKDRPNPRHIKISAKGQRLFHRKGGGSVMGEPFAGSPIAFNQGSGHRICKESVFPKVHQIKRRPKASFLFGGPEGIRTLGLRDANESKAVLCVDF